jgi:hypothetical protein
MIENIIIFLVFALSLAYLIHTVWKQFSAKNTAGCAKGCGACGAIDFSKIEQQIAAKEKQALEKIPV